MDTNALKKFAQAARNLLIDQVTSKLDLVLDPASPARREHPTAMKALECAIGRDGKTQVIEKVAYTWFNRFTALRFMDANGYTNPRVVSPAEGQTRPEILAEAMAGNLPDGASPQIAPLLDGRAPSNDPQGEAYRLLLVHACNAWHGPMPFLFEEIDDYTELLMPEDLLSQTSILARLRDVMSEKACQDVEIIGWLYQFYISEKKDEVFAGLKKNVKITAENIPAATQLFTPHWIVRYLVENSLGRLWLLNRPTSRLAERMDYYIAPEEPETDFLHVSRPEEIRICDPAAGSGHMLTYAFDLLHAIYEEEGYDPTEIPGLILKHNLTGVEIDDRAGALAAFALAMKAAAKLGRRRFLRMEVTPDIVVLQEHTFRLNEFDDFLSALGYDLNADRISGDLKAVPLAMSGVWSHITRYLKAADGAAFEDVFEGAMQRFETNLAEEVGLFEEASQNPFLTTQLQDLRAELFAIAHVDAKQKERKALEKNFAKTAKSPHLAARVAKAGADYHGHRNDTTYRMDLDALVERAEEAARSPNALAKLKVLAEKLIEAVGFHAPLWATLRQFEHAKDFGSLIVPALPDPGEALRLVEVHQPDDWVQQDIQRRIWAVLRMAEALSPRYHIVVANPPYAGAKGLNPKLKSWIEQHYPMSKADLMTCFMDRATLLTREKSFWGMINLPSWLFLSSFSELRRTLLVKSTISSLLQLGRGVFGADFGAVAFIIRTSRSTDGEKSYFRRLFDKHVEVRSPEAIEARFLDKTDGAYWADPIEFTKIPGAPVAYWVNETIRGLFSAEPALSEKIEAKQGVATADNDRFLRQWWEPALGKTIFDASSNHDVVQGKKSWVSYNKGGEFRRWYGNQEFIVNWEDSGKELYEFRPKAVIRNPDYFFRRSVSWSDVTSGGSAFRLYPQGFIFDSTGHSAFASDTYSEDQILCYANTKLAQALFNIINPTIHLHVGYFKSLPALEVTESEARRIAQGCVARAKSDWDAYETSWDFTILPLLSPDHRGETLAENYTTLRAHWQSMTDDMQRLEEENNRIFIDAYGLQDELTPEVPIEEITLTCNPAYRYGVKGSEKDREIRLRADTMAEFLSYAVACMFGRYSLDEPGLILANQGETLADYLARVPSPSFTPDEDNVIPVLDGDWFPDDITERFRLFLRTTFGDDHFQENLKFIEDALGKDIRKYFTKDFYADHVKRYKKRPIYWLFSSPKGTFSALIYMHRYRADTVSVLLNDYLREFISKLRAERARLDKLADDPTATQGERTKALKEAGKVAAQIDELDDWEREVVFPLAQQKIEIDLDDGVKANYPKFGAALKKITGLS